MNPEERARKEIDRHLRESGWAVQDYPEMNIYATTGVAVHECPLRKGHGTVDYLLYADGKAIGSVEAKPEGGRKRNSPGMQMRARRRRKVGDRTTRSQPHGIPPIYRNYRRDGLGQR